MKKIITKILIFILLFIPVFQTKAWLSELEPQLNPWVWAFLKSFVSSNLWKLDFLKKIVEIINRDINKYTPTQQIALTYFKLLIESSINWNSWWWLVYWSWLPWVAINNPTWKCSFLNPCKEGDFCRIKTWECFPLVHKDRWFRWFKLSWRTIQVSCNTADIKAKINSAWDGDTVLIPSWCTFSWRITFTNDKVVIRWWWMWKTIFNWMFEPKTKDVIISDMTIHASWYMWWIDAYRNTGWNMLFERLEIDWAWRAWDIKITKNPYFTVRYCKLSNSLHWVANKMANKSQIYSNEAFNNSNYWMDSSTVDKVEIAWNYFHNNSEAWAKTPNAKELHYHHNDMINNGKAWIVYYRDWSNSWEEFWRNTLNQKWEVTLEYNDLTWNSVWFNWVWAQNTEPQMNYLIVRNNKMTKFNCKKCWRIEIWWNNWVLDFPFWKDWTQVIRH